MKNLINEIKQKNKIVLNLYLLLLKINLEKLHTEASTKLININNLHRGSKTKNQNEIERIMHVRQNKEIKKYVSKIEAQAAESVNLDLKAIKT